MRCFAVRRAILMLLVAACGTDRAATTENHAVQPPPPPRRIATAWQRRCLAALEQLCRDAAVYEPALRSAEVKIDDVREEVGLAAFPPVWDIPGVFITVEHETKPVSRWQRFNEPFHGSNHISWLRSTGTYNAAIMLEGWENDRARRLEPALIKGVEGCL